MGRKATVEAPSNIAFVKYWGVLDPERVLPCNPSISMTLSACVSRTTVELCDALRADEVLLAAPDGELTPAPERFGEGVVAHLDRLRTRLGFTARVRVATRNSFPSEAGIASSASGFAALACAVAEAAGAETTAAERSILARLSGSGSAARSVLGGYVEWPGPGAVEGAAEVLAPAEHWDLRDVIAIVDAGAKPVSSREGHRRVGSSPYFERRLEALPVRLTAVRDALRRRDLTTLGRTLEEEAVDLHVIAMTSRPAIFYWRPATLEVLDRVRGLREEGIEAYFTMDAGPNVHVLCAAVDEARVAAALGAVDGVDSVLRDRVGLGPRSLDRHLF